MGVVAGPKDRKYECTSIALFVIWIVLAIGGIGMLGGAYWTETATLKMTLAALGAASIMMSWGVGKILKSRLTRL